jgi:hypothetical protein
MVRDMARTELEEEDELKARAVADEKKVKLAEEEANRRGRHITPIYLRKGDMSRFCEGKKKVLKNSIDKYTDEILVILKAAETLKDKDSEKLLADVTHAHEAAKKAMSEYNTQREKADTIMDELIADESWYQTLNVKDIQKHILNKINFVTKNDKETGSACSLSMLSKAVSAFSKTVTTRPQDKNAIGGDTAIVIVGAIGYQ